MGNSGISIGNLPENVREYIETRIELIKLETVDSGASAVSTMIAWSVISIIGIIGLVMLSIASAIGIGYLVDNFAVGFFIVTGIYLIIGVVLYYYRIKWLRKPFLNVIIKNLYDDE